MSEYAVMPLADYDAACDKVREKVGEQTILLEETDFGYLRSAPFSVVAGKTYTVRLNLTDAALFQDVVVAEENWDLNQEPWNGGLTNPFVFEAASDKTCCAFFGTDNGLTANDILSATLECDGEVVADFAPPLKIKSGEMVDRVEDVYEAGKQAERERFWRNFFKGGAFGGMFAGGGWNVETFKPIYPAEKIKITTRNGGDRLFYNFNRPSNFVQPLVDLAEFCEHSDFSECPYLDFTFDNARAKNLNLDLSNCTTLNRAFSSGNGGQLENVTVKVTENCIGYINPFFYQSEMKELHFTEDSVIAANITFAQSSALTHDSLMSIINALKDYSDTTTTKTLTLHANSKALLTDAEKAIATEKGWTLA